MREAVLTAANSSREEKLLFLAVGDKAQIEIHEGVEIRVIDFVHDPGELATFHRAADLYIHAAKAENHSLSILQALASGKPVIATAVGGIPEQIRSYTKWRRDDGSVVGPVPFEDATGALVERGDAREMSTRILEVLNHPQSAQLGHNSRAAMPRVDSTSLSKRKLISIGMRTFFSKEKIKPTLLPGECAALYEREVTKLNQGTNLSIVQPVELLKTHVWTE